MEELLSLRAQSLLLSQLRRRKRRSGGGWKGGKERTNRLRGGRRWARKGISHNIGETRSMLDGEGKFCKEGQLSLLPSRFRWGEAVEGGN